MKAVNWNFNEKEKIYSVEFQLPEEIDSTTVIDKSVSSLQGYSDTVIYRRRFFETGLRPPVGSGK